MSRRRETQWWEYLDGSEAPPLALHGIRSMRRLFAHLPSDPRCKFCAVPFTGLGGKLVRPFGKRPSSMTPYLCMSCELAAQKQGGGGETEATLVFADIRGSTPLAERLSGVEFSALVDRFYRVTTEALVKADGFIEKIAGDEVTAVFFPGFAGDDHAAKAVSAARRVIGDTGHDDPQGPWVPVGVGVHTGRVVIRIVGGEHGTVDHAVLGDAANVAARITAQAGAGEVLVSEDAARAARLDVIDLEVRNLDLKGKSEPVRVRVLA